MLDGPTRGSTRLAAAADRERQVDYREMQHSIRINDQFRVCFVWTKDEPERVEITDYH